MVTAAASPTLSSKRSLPISNNPRRSHPSQSKSLPKNKRLKIDHPEKSDESGEEPPAAQVSGGKAPKLPVGESRDSSSDQSAAKWFDRVNENVQPSQNKNGRSEGISGDRRTLFDS